MAKKLPESINLLEPVNAPDDIWESLYFWVFNVGKYLFVSVELIVLLVFFSRFTFDKINSDLTRDINEMVEQLSNDYYSQLEARFNNLHTLLGDVAIQSEEQDENSKLIASVLDGIPTYIQMQNFSYRDRSVNIKFTAIDLAKIKQFEQVLKRNPAYSEITVRINRSENSPIFDCNVSFKIIPEELLEEGSVSGASDDSVVRGVQDYIEENGLTDVVELEVDDNELDSE